MMSLRTLRLASWLALASAAMCLYGVMKARTAPPASRGEPEGIRQAEGAVLASLAVATSPRGQSLCIQTPIACVGPDRLELAISLLAATNSPESLRALAGLVRFGLDGAYAEDYDAVVLGKGRAIEPFLRALSPQRLHEQCQRELRELLRTSGPVLGEVREDYVCRSADSISAEVTSTLDAILHHRRAE